MCYYITQKVFMANELERQRYIRSLSRDDLERLVSILSFSPLLGVQENTPLDFTPSEVEKMPKTFKKEFRTDGCTARVYRRKIGEESYTYDIKYRRNSYNVTVTDKNLDVAKKKFIEKLKTAEKVIKSNSETGSVVPTTFNAFSIYFFEKFRIKKVSKQTYQSDLNRYKKNLLSYFKERPLKLITAEQCQNLLDDIVAKGKGKTADEIFSLMSIIFKAAISHGIIAKNPLDIVVHRNHEREHGTALTKDEERILLSVPNEEERLMFAVALYTGMRPNEYETAKIDEKFIVCKNSKRKNGKVEYKKIPISPMLAPFLKNVSELKIYKPYTMREKLGKILPNHILYDLRTTFYSRCKECGVSEYALSEFMGHSLGALGNAYTDLSDEFLLKEGQKIKY